MDGEEVGVFKEVDKESLGGFLEGLDGLGLPAEFVVHGAAGDGYFADLFFGVKNDTLLLLP